jgi:hypothetical protein
MWGQLAIVGGQHELTFRGPCFTTRRSTCPTRWLPRIHLRGRWTWSRPSSGLSREKSGSIHPRDGNLDRPTVTERACGAAAGATTPKDSKRSLFASETAGRDLFRIVCRVSRPSLGPRPSNTTNGPRPLKPALDDCTRANDPPYRRWLGCLSHQRARTCPISRALVKTTRSALPTTVHAVEPSAARPGCRPSAAAGPTTTPIAMALYSARQPATDRPLSALRTASPGSVGERTSAAGLVVVSEIGGARTNTSRPRVGRPRRTRKAANRADPSCCAR